VYPIAALAQTGETWSPAERDASIALGVFVGLYVAVFSILARGEADRGPTVAAGFRCDRCGARDIADRTACPGCGQAIDPANGQGLLGYRRADGLERGPWLEWLAIIPTIGIIAAASPRGEFGLLAAVPAGLAFFAVTMTAGRRVRSGAATGPAIGLWIAAIALVDATLLLALGNAWLGLGAAACFLVARLAARRIVPS
jgi:hypothetical protein